jgi:hypothetical protein
MALGLFLYTIKNDDRFVDAARYACANTREDDQRFFYKKDYEPFYRESPSVAARPDMNVERPDIMHDCHNTRYVFQVQILTYSDLEFEVFL